MQDVTKGVTQLSSVLDMGYSSIKRDLVYCYGVTENRIIGIRQTWWSIDNYSNRKSWIVEQLKTIPDGKRLLDAGAGNQHYRPFCDHLEYVSQDFGKYDTQSIEEGVENTEKWNSLGCDIISDIISIPVEDNSFDVILCSEVIGHIKNPVLAIKEFSRILRPNGTLLLTAPFCSLTHMAPFYYSNGFSKYWYYDVLQDAGLDISEIKANGNFFSYLAQELIRSIEIFEKYSGKPLSVFDYDTLYNSIKSMMIQAECTKGSEDVLCFGYFVKAFKR